MLRDTYITFTFPTMLHSTLSGHIFSHAANPPRVDNLFMFNHTQDLRWLISLEIRCLSKKLSNHSYSTPSEFLREPSRRALVASWRWDSSKRTMPPCRTCLNMHSVLPCTHRLKMRKTTDGHDVHPEEFHWTVTTLATLATCSGFSLPLVLSLSGPVGGQVNSLVWLPLDHPRLMPSYQHLGC